MFEKYDGCRWLEEFGTMFGVQIDQVNFAVGCIFAIVMGQLLPKPYCYEKTDVCRRLVKFYNRTVRLLVEALIGFLLLYYCFGIQVVYFAAEAISAYLLILILPAGLMGPTVTVVAMTYLSVAHFFRLNYDYGGYTMDITGPLMILTQKMSCLAFNVADGIRQRRGHQLGDANHTRHAVSVKPSLIEFLGFTFYYHGILAGPMVFYTDYMDYIGCYGLKTLPSSREKMKEVLLPALWYGFLTVYVAPMVPLSLLLSKDFERLSFPRKLVATYVSLFLARQKYYFAWSLTELGGLSAGLGYRGRNPTKGTTNWDGVKNFDLLKVECGNSFKVIIDGWNITTTYWLREVFYTRAPRVFRTALVFFSSAFWHGFYPAYYMVFLTFLLFTHISRILRRAIRPHFQSHIFMRMFYDVLTTVTSSLAITYSEAPFHFLFFDAGVLFWKNFFFLPHALSFGFLVFYHLKPRMQNQGPFQLRMPLMTNAIYPRGTTTM